MAVQTTISLVIVKLIELQKEIKDPSSTMGSQVEGSIKQLVLVQESLEDQESDLLGPELLQAVYRADDTIDTFLREIRKEFNQQNLFIKALSAGIDLRSAYIKTRFSDKLKKLVGVIKETSNKMLEDVAAKSTADNGGSDKENGLLDLKEVKDLAEFMLTCHSSPFKISVVDVPRSAKTGELWKMYNCDDIKNYFRCRAWVQVPQKLEQGGLAIDILKQIAGPEVELKLPSVKSVQHELRNFLIQERYLVVLIDVRSPDIWEIVKFLCPNSLNGSRVILSFREADAARHPNVMFFGGELLLSLNDKRESSAKSEGVVYDNADTIPSPVSEEEISEEETDIVGMKDELLKLAQLTLNAGKKYFLISVVGVAGSGKTTLVKTIYNSSYTRRNFECRAWVNVYVSYDFDMRNVLVGILEQITQVKVEEELPPNELENMISRSLEKKRYLIVLDDVHFPGAWYDLQPIFSPKSSKGGSRVILITREAHVGRSFSTSISLHEIRLLNEDESCKLFLKKFQKEESSPELLGNIWKICGGLPLAISVLGGLLSTLPDSEWSGVIKQITSGRKKKGKKQAASNEDHSISLDELTSLDTSSVWGLGYKFLSSHLRACLHYFSLFPKLDEVPVRRLLQLWVAERLVTPSEVEGMAPDSPEDRAKNDFEQLERRNMIEVVKWRSDGRPKTCRVPSTLYDTFQNAEKMGYLHFHHKGKSDSTSNVPEFGIRRLAEHLDNQNNSTPSDKHLEYLHSYLSFDNRKGDKPADEVGDLLNKTITKRGYRLLRVLDLEGVYKPVLPETIGKLQLLRYVGLRWTFLDSIPESVGDLLCLETLDLKHTNITSLPKSIWKVKTLRHLYMNDIHLQMSIQKPFVRCSLTNLQSLWGLLIGKKSPPFNWLESLSGLRTLGLTCHIASLGKITKWIQGLTSLESLRLRSINDFGEPSDLDIGSLINHEKLKDLYLLGRFPGPLKLDQLPPNLKIFTLSLSYLSEDPMPVLGQLKELNILRLYAHSYLGEKMTCGSGAFPKLRVLKLWVLKELNEWTIGKEAMPALRELEIRCCQKLRKPNELDKVTTLKEMTLTDMKKSFEDEVRGSMAKTVNIVINHPPDKYLYYRAKALMESRHRGELKSSVGHHRLLLQALRHQH